MEVKLRIYRQVLENFYVVFIQCKNASLLANVKEFLGSGKLFLPSWPVIESSFNQLTCFRITIPKL